MKSWFIVVFHICILGVIIQAVEFMERNPLFLIEMHEEDALSFHRPLRRWEESPEDHPNSRGLLPPVYTEGKINYYDNLIVTQAALDHPRTQQYIGHYTNTGGMDYISTVMANGGPYLAFIRREIAALDLPPELIYLPLIESSYTASAMSRSGASGLWQFMENSMGPFDMRVTDWMDERRDFWKATQGGLRKLKENHDFFGDWHLALAAYNAGLGAVNRMMQQSGYSTYWALLHGGHLAAETALYVPRLAAVTYVLSNQRRYGLNISWPEDPRWQRIAVDRSVDLRLLAAYAGIEAEELIWANRELLYDITPPEPGYFLKVNAENAGKVAAVLERMDIALVQHHVHVIRSGDTLLALAQHFGVTVDQIMTANPGVEPRFLRIGSRLVIPSLRDAGPFIRPPAEVYSFNGSHLVKSGETLWSIAMAYGVTTEALAEANDMNLSDILREGRVLRTPIR